MDFVLGVFVVSLSIAQSDLGANLLQSPHTHLNFPDQQTYKSCAFTEIPTLAVDHLITCSKGVLNFS